MCQLQTDNLEQSSLVPFVKGAKFFPVAIVKVWI